MATTNIAKEILTALILLSDIEAETFDKLKSAVQSAKPRLRVQQFARDMFVVFRAIPETQLSNLIEALVEIRTFQTFNGATDEELLKAVIEDLAETEPRPSNIENISRRLASLLSIDKPVQLVAKARGLLLENDRAFTDARTVTDIRPIFHSDVETPPAAALIVHNLRISYLQESTYHEFYVLLDSDDVQKLQDVLARALRKEKTLRETLHRADIMEIGG